MLTEIDKSSLALDKAVSEAVSDLREQNMETVSQSVLVFVTYTIGSLFLVRLSNMSLVYKVFRSSLPRCPHPPVPSPKPWMCREQLCLSLGSYTRSTKTYRFYHGKLSTLHMTLRLDEELRLSGRLPTSAGN